MSKYKHLRFLRFAICRIALRLALRKNNLISVGALLAAVLAVPLGAQTDGTVSVDLSTTNQTIRGFGGASVWMGTMTDAEMDELFGNGPNQLGFTIDRVRIDPTQNWAAEISNAQKAAARGAIVFATPWSPPASMKDNGNVVGGSLLTSQYGAYASYLQSFVDTMAANGVSLYAVSMQNEPEANVTYESCSWTPTQMLDFVKNDAGAITGTNFMMPESFRFDHTYSDPVLNDATAASQVAIIAGHIYCGGACINPYPLAASLGKDVWMTEHLENDTDIAGAVNTGLEITKSMAVANFNAYVTWWWRRYYSVLDDTPGPTYDTITKRGYVMGQFSKFIRPGYVRVNSTYNPSTNVYTSAYMSDSDNVVIVAVNVDATNSYSEQFSISSGTVCSVVPYRTSGTENISTLSTIPVVDGSFTATLPPQSVTTFVSLNSPPPPVPTGLTATAVSSSQINLSWTASSGATSYNVKRATISGGGLTRQLRRE